MNSTGIDSQLLAAALSDLPIGIVVVGPAGELARASSRARELLGGDLSLLDDALAAALQGEQIHGIADVGPRAISFDARPLREGGATVVGAVAMVQDVSDQRRREQAERDFIANAAHELRTPLAAIAGAVEVLEDGAKELRSERDLFISHIARQSDRLQRVIGALLAIARFDARIERPRIEIVPLRRLLSSVAGELVPAPGVAVAVRCRADLAVLAAPDLLEEAVANVAANAVRYTERGSVLLACRAEEESAVLVVRDTGQGIPAADQERVFERFYRSGHRDAQGFGLGLSIARRAIEAMGGTIRLAGEEGKGTTVEIRLPLAHLVEKA